MPDRLKQTFARTRSEGRAALAPFVTVGYPSVEATLEIVPALVAAGADVIELGVPFSDPLAEGPTIQRSSQHALERGVTAASAMKTVARLRELGVTVPLVFMGYYNPVLSYGPGRYCEDAALAGVDGLIIPDLPAEEASDLRGRAVKSGLSLVPLIALTSPEERIELVCRDAAGFIYCVGVLGVTGVGSTMFDRVEELVATVRRHSDLPVGVGFGVRTPGDARRVAEFADAVLVGSALVDVIGAGSPTTRVTAESPGAVAARAGDFIRDMARELAAGTRGG